MMSKVYFNDRIVDANGEFLKSMSPGELKGRGVFETLLIKDRKIYAWDDHLKRLKRGLDVQSLFFPIDAKKYKTQILNLFRLSRLKIARVRISIWEKNGRMQSLVVVHPLKRPRKLYKIHVSSYVHPQKPIHSFKTLDYHVFHKAFLEASKEGFDEAILLGRKKIIVEGARSNIFFLRGQCLYTPSLKSLCLVGITRKYVLRAARNLGLCVRERDIFLSDLFEADLVFVSNSLLGIQLVDQINGRALAVKSKGATEKLKAEYQKLLSK